MESACMESALVDLALNSPSRVLPYKAVAEHLGVEESSVELIALNALDAGAISGCIDAEHEHIVINSTRLPQATSENVRQAAIGLDQLEAQLTAELDTRKRSRNVLDDHTELAH